MPKPIGSILWWHAAQLGRRWRAKRSRRPAKLWVVEVVLNARRRRQRGVAEQPLKHPFTALDRRGAGGKGGQRQDAAVGKQPASAGRLAVHSIPPLDLIERSPLFVEAVVGFEARIDHGGRLRERVGERSIRAKQPA